MYACYGSGINENGLDVERFEWNRGLVMLLYMHLEVLHFYLIVILVFLIVLILFGLFIYMVFRKPRNKRSSQTLNKEDEKPSAHKIRTLPLYVNKSNNF